MSAISEKLEELISAGYNSTTELEHESWERRVGSFLPQAFDAPVPQDFRDLSSSGLIWGHRRDSELGMLEGLAAYASAAAVSTAVAALPGVRPSSAPAARQSKKVFVVHGHDNETKEAVARFLERLGLEAVILHEQPSSGRTLIEKFEVYADVGFAVVLLTPDDLGGPAVGGVSSPQPRARQNVILELGYFTGKLSRHRVCALYKKGVEIPSDFQGVVYVELDRAGAWHVQLAQELSAAGVPIDLKGIFKKS